MKNIKLFNFLLDKNFSTTILNNVAKLIRGPIAAFFIILYLNPEEQGYWYAFQSLLVFIAIGELGFSKIVTLKVSEYVIKLKGNKRISIFKNNIKNLSSFIFINYILYFVIALLSFFIIYILVISFYNEWPQALKETFFICLLFSSLSLFNTLQGAIFYGLNLVYWKNIQEFIFGITFTASLVLFLYLDYKIYSLVFSILIANLSCQLFFIKYYIKWINKMFKYVDFNLGVNLLKDLKFLQIKYGLVTLMSLYITNSIVPFTIKYFNPVLAGQIGFSYFVISSLVLMAWTFFYIQYPNILQLISLDKLDKVYNKSIKYFKQINISLIILFTVFFLLIDFVSLNIIEIKSRMLPTNYLLLICFSQIVLLNIGFFASLVRGFQVEPYWKLSLLQIFSTTGLYFIAVLADSIYLFFLIDAFLHLIILLPFSLYLGRKKLKQIYVSR